MVLAPRKFLLSCCSILCVLLALAIGGILHFLNRSILPEGKFFATVIPAFSGFIPPTVLHTETADVAGVPSLHCDPEGRSAHEKACDLAPRPAKEMFIPMPSGAQMPANGLGMCCRPAAYGFEAARRQVLHYLRLGGRLIDTAELYLNHVPISLALHQAMEAKEKGGWGIPRSEIFLVTKVWPRHYGRETVKLRVREIVRGNSTKWLPHEAARARAEHLDEDAESSRSLSLRLHFADLVLMHQPVSWQAGLAGKLVGNGMGMSAECATLTFQECRKQTWIGLSELVAEGVVKNIGVSNFNVAHMKELQHLRESSNAGTVPIQSIATNQIMWNPWAPPFQQTVYDYCMENKISVMAYGSLGTAFQFKQAASSTIIKKIASTTGRSPPQVLLRWALQHGGHSLTAIIPGTAKTEHMAANLAVYDFDLSNEHMAALDKLHDAEEAAQFAYMEWPEGV